MPMATALRATTTRQKIKAVTPTTLRIIMQHK